MKKRLSLFFVVALLVFSMGSLSNNASVKGETPLSNTGSDVTAFEGVGRFYFNYLSGANNYYNTEFNITAANKRDNDPVMIPDVEGQYLGETKINNISGEYFGYEYMDSSVFRATLTFRYYSRSKSYSGGEYLSPEVFIVKLDKSEDGVLNITDYLAIEDPVVIDEPEDGKEGLRFFQIDVTDFMNENGEGIYAIANIPLQYNRAERDGGLRWDIAVIIESPEVPISYTHLVKNPMFVRNHTGSGASNTISYNIENPGIFKTNAEGTINSNLLVVGQHRVVGNSQNISDRLSIRQYHIDDGDNPLSNEVYFNEYNTNLDFFGGVAYSTTNGQINENQYFPSLDQTKRLSHLGPTKIVDTKFGDHLKNDVSKIGFDYTMLKNSNLNTSGGVNLLGLSVEILPPTYTIDYSTVLQNTSEAYKNKNYYYQGQTVEHVIVVKNDSKDQLGLSNTYLELVYDADTVAIDLNKIQVLTSTGQPITTSRNEVVNGKIRIYLGEKTVNDDHVTLDQSSYTIKFENTFLQDQTKDGITFQANINGNLLTYGGDSTDLNIFKVAEADRVINQVKRPVISFDNFVFKQYVAPQDLSAKNAVIQDVVFDVDGVTLTLKEPHLVDFDKAGIYTIEYSYLNPDGILVAEQGTVTITPRYYLDTIVQEGTDAITYGPFDPSVAIDVPTEPTRENYIFGGWYEDLGYQTIFDFSSGITEDTTIYAKWDLETFNVSFESNLGSSVATQVVDYNTTASEPTDPTRTGYTFGGWYANEALTTEYDFATLVTEDKILYAKWTINSYTVDFESNGGSLVDEQVLEFNSTATKPTDPTRTGYTFGGWFTDEALSTEYDFATLVTEDKTLYAKWTINSYVVDFESNGGSLVDEQVLEYNSTATKPTDPTKLGYTFGGWFTDEALSTEYDFETLVTKDKTLYAKWTINSYVVDFESNGGSLIDEQVLEHNSTANKPLDPIRTGYTFDGWYSDEALTSEYDFETLVTEDKTLFAKWIVDRYTVQYESNGGSEVNDEVLDYNTSANEPLDPTREGYVFKGWYRDQLLTDEFDFSSLIIEDTMLYAKWEIDQEGGDIDVEKPIENPEVPVEKPVEEPGETLPGTGISNNYSSYIILGLGVLLVTLRNRFREKLGR